MIGDFRAPFSILPRVDRCPLSGLFYPVMSGQAVALSSYLVTGTVWRNPLVRFNYGPFDAQSIRDRQLLLDFDLSRPRPDCL